MIRSHGRSDPILHFDPIRAPPRPVRPVTSLRDDALSAERAGVAEDGLAVAVEVLAQSDARARLAQEAGEGRVRTG